jgi:stage V sporulation protein G
LIKDIKVIKSTTRLFVSMPTRKQRDGIHLDIAYPINTETRNMIEEAVLAEYEKVVAGSENQKANSADR